MFRGGALRIGSIRGIPIRIHVTFLIVLPLLAVGFGRVFTDAARAAGVPADRLRGAPVLWGLVVAIALFASVLVHELAHSLYALRKGGRVRDITLIMIGGVSQISELPRPGRVEAVMAVVGPLTSLALGGAFYVLHRALAATGQFELTFTAFHLFYLNVALGLFNLLPAFPMDGGRVLRGLLEERWGALRATRVSADAGKVFALLFAIVGFVTVNILLMVIAFFVYVGAEAENRSVLVKALLGKLRVRDLPIQRTEPAEASTSVYELGERMIRERRVAYPVEEEGATAGIVTLDDVKKVPREERHRLQVRDVVRRVEPVDAADEAARAVRALMTSNVAVVPVVEQGHLVAVLSQLDLARGLQLKELEATQHPSPPPPIAPWTSAEQRV